MKFTVYEDRWLRGGKNPDGEYVDSSLLDGEGNMCCVGQLALACGVPAVRLAQASYLRTLLRYPDGVDNIPESIRPFSTKYSLNQTWEEYHDGALELIYYLNDSVACDDEKRKSRLREEFAKHDIQVDFEPTSPDPKLRTL